MSPREKAARRGNEIEDMLQDETLSADERIRLERELDAISDNMAEGCYSNDPDDGINWSDCPGISVSPKIAVKAGSLKFYTPPIAHYLLNPNGGAKAASDTHVPDDIVDAYRVSVEDALGAVPCFYIGHPDVAGVKPGVEVHYGKMYGTLDAALCRGLTQEGLGDLQEMLTDLASRWSVFFETFAIKVDDGILKVRFYEGSEALMAEAVFANKAYMENCLSVTDAVKFYEHESSIQMVYFNPDSEAGGQLVYNILYPCDLKRAFNECKNDNQFWECLNECACQFQTDIDTDEFISEIRHFAEAPCDYSGESKQTMEAMKCWLDMQFAGMEQSQGMNMGQT